MSTEDRELRKIEFALCNEPFPEGVEMTFEHLDTSRKEYSFLERLGRRVEVTKDSVLFFAGLNVLFLLGMGYLIFLFLFPWVTLIVTAFCVLLGFWEPVLRFILVDDSNQKEWAKVTANRPRDKDGSLIQGGGIYYS